MADTVRGANEAARDRHIPNGYPWLKAYPKNADWYATLRGEALHDILDRTVRDYGASTCTYFMGATKSYKEIGAEVDKAALGLQQMGVKKGTRVGLLLPNVPYYPILYYAILKAGGIVVNFNPLYTIEEITHQAKDSGTNIMATLDLAALFPKVEALLASGTLHKAIVCPFPKILPGLKSMLFKLLKCKELAKTGSSRAKRARSSPMNELIDNDASYARTPHRSRQRRRRAAIYRRHDRHAEGAMLTHANLSINRQAGRSLRDAISARAPNG